MNQEPEKFTNTAAQGDVLLVRVNALPSGLKRVEPVDDKYILAHSETGHHHVVEADPEIQYWDDPANMLRSYLVVDKIIGTILEHLRSFDTHGPIEVGKGIYRVIRQRSFTPKGWERVAD